MTKTNIRHATFNVTGLGRDDIMTKAVAVASILSSRHPVKWKNSSILDRIN